MQLIAYILIYPFLYLISLLPFRLLYVLSDFVFVLVFYVLGYRRQVVSNNLELVFPYKSKSELKSIEKKFYRHMCDMFLEMIKSLTISDKQLRKRFVFKNNEELERLESLNKSVIVMYGHYASYEWSVVVGYFTNLKALGIYKQIKNKYFDKLVKGIRSRYNITLIPTKQAISAITEFENDNVNTIVAFLSDQSPKLKKAHHWLNFMGVKVPSFTGAEMMAKRLDMSVTFLKIEKVKRGYYEAEYVPLADNSRDFRDYEITDKFTKILEKQIEKAPEYYLWTHKRWKHRNAVPKEFQ